MYMRKGKICLYAAIALIFMIACVIVRPSSDKKASQSSSIERDTGKQYMYVKSDGLNVRKGPDADSSIVTVIYQNDRVVTDKVSYNGWYKVASLDESYSGYVNAAYLTDKPLTEAQIAAMKAEAVAKALEAKAAAEQAAETQISEEATLETESVLPSQTTPHVTLTKRQKN